MLQSSVGVLPDTGLGPGRALKVQQSLSTWGKAVYALLKQTVSVVKKSVKTLIKLLYGPLVK